MKNPYRKKISKEEKANETLQLIIDTVDAVLTNENTLEDLNKILTNDASILRSMMPIFIKSNISEMAERYANCLEKAQKYLKKTDENIILIAGTMRFIIEVDKMSICYGVKL